MKSSFAAGLFADRQLNFLVGVNVLVVMVATWLSRGQFLDIDNLQSMGGQLPELGLLALGIMLSMVSGNGGIDLSGRRPREPVGHGGGDRAAAEASSIGDDSPMRSIRRLLRDRASSWRSAARRPAQRRRDRAAQAHRRFSARSARSCSSPASRW